MSKLLRFLIVLLLLLSIASLTLAIMLYNKRELLKGRTQQLEDTVTLLAATVEPIAPSVNTPSDYPARDTGAVTAELVENPERAKFWETYAHSLECVGPATMSLGGRRSQLMTYYRRDPVTLKVMRDPLTGLPLTDGPGTMRELLDELLEKASGQYARLNDTRDELTKTRKELVTSVTELNERKQGLRLALNTVLKRDGTIAQLEDTVLSRDRTIRGHEEHIAEQDLTIREKTMEIAEREEDIHQLKSDVKLLEDRIAALTTPTNSAPYAAWAELTPGYKGRVAEINLEYQFVVLELTDEFIEQYLKALKNTVLQPDPNLMVIRGDGGVDERFVTKVRLRRVYPDRKTATADILGNWQQAAVEKGDAVVY